VNTEEMLEKSQSYLRTFCQVIPERCVGSEGNRQATCFFEHEIASFGWKTETDEFDAIDWEDGGATLEAGNHSFEVLASPYSLACSTTQILQAVSTLTELEQADLQGKIVLLHGEISREQLMPKNFIFYNPDEHQRIISLLEEKRPAAIISATGRNAALAGGVYPFPLIDDGDFDIPSVYMTEEEGLKLLPLMGQTARLVSRSRRIPGKGTNVTARKGNDATQRIVITAHIDAIKGTPGAIDNASGVVVLLLLAELLADYEGNRMLEIVALNGEDYYAVSGQMDYLKKNQDRFHEILFNINLDGAGYREGKTAVSFYELPLAVKEKLLEIMTHYPGMTEGTQWYQGDHGIFTQNGRPAMAVSSEWFTENIDSQEITHTPKDRPEIVDCARLVEIAAMLAKFLPDV